MNLAVVDTVVYLMGFFNGQNLSSALQQRLISLVFHFQKDVQISFVQHTEYINSMYEKVAEQWSAIMSAILIHGYEHIKIY